MATLRVYVTRLAKNATVRLALAALALWAWLALTLANPQ